MAVSADRDLAAGWGFTPTVVSYDNLGHATGARGGVARPNGRLRGVNQSTTRPQPLPSATGGAYPSTALRPYSGKTPHRPNVNGARRFNDVSTTTGALTGSPSYPPSRMTPSLPFLTHFVHLPLPIPAPFILLPTSICPLCCAHLPFSCSLLFALLSPYPLCVPLCGLLSSQR